MSALVALLTALCAGASEARNIEEICQALVHEANRVGPALGERDIYELSDALVAAVPTRMRYLEPRSAQPGEVEALVGCNDWDACEARYGDTLEGLIGNDSGPWWTQIVDTRPVSNEVFVYTAHSGIFRSDQFAAFEQQPGKQLKLMPLGFSELDQDFDTGYAILLAGEKPYVVVPPGALSFADFSGYWPTKQVVDLNLSVHDPRSTTASCAVSYHALPRSTVSADSMLSQIEPQPALRDGIHAFLDRNLEAMAEKTRLGGDLGEIVSVEPLFVSSKLASDELARLEALLADRRKLGFLRAQERALAKSVFDSYWDSLETSNEVETWEIRWFPVEVAGQGYVGLMLRTGPFAFNPKLDSEKSVVALFALEDDRLKPVAAYEIQSTFHFVGAEVRKDQ